MRNPWLARASERVVVDPSHDGVAIFASAFFPSLGGVEELSRQHAIELTTQGFAPIVVTMRWPPELPVNDSLDGVPIWRGRFALPEPDLRSMYAFARFGPPLYLSLVRELRRRRVRIIHVQCVSNNGLFAWLAARTLRVPLVVSLQGELSMDSTGVYQRSAVLPWTLKQLMRRAEAVTACSKQTLEEAEAFAGRTLGKRGTVVYNGVRLGEFDAGGTEVRTRPYLLAIGRHVWQKGFDVLIDAFASSGAADTHDLVIAGDGPDHEALIRQVAEGPCHHAIEFVGRTDRLRTVALFRGCDVFVLPSRHEPMGIVNLEAMASGKPVIATGVGGVPELVVNEVTGILVAPGDPQPLAAAITRLLRDPALRQNLGAAGRNRASSFDWAAITRNYTDLYRSVMP